LAGVCWLVPCGAVGGLAGKALKRHESLLFSYQKPQSKSWYKVFRREYRIVR
jgi:hypothetical protein